MFKPMVYETKISNEWLLVRKLPLENIGNEKSVIGFTDLYDLLMYVEDFLLDIKDTVKIQ